MFQEGLKREFMKHYNANTINLETLFSLTEPVELTFGKDLCNFTVDEIIYLLRTFGNGSQDTIAVKVSVMRNYTEWVIRENPVNSIDMINHFDLLSYEDLEQCINKVKSNSRIIKHDIVDDIYNNTKLNLSTQALVALVYNGIYGKSGSEIYELRVEDIADGKVYVKSRELYIPISKREEIIIITAFNSYENNTVDERSYSLDPADPTVLKRPAKGKSVDNLESFNNRISKRTSLLSDYIGRKVSITRLIFSGFVNKAQLIKEKNGYTTYAELENDNEFKKLLEYYSESQKPAFQVRAKYKKYLEGE